MAIKRSNDQVLVELKKREQHLKHEIVKAQLYADGIKTSFWKSIELILLKRLSIIEAEKLKCFSILHESNDRKLIRLLGNEEIINNVLGVKNYAKSVDKFKDLLLEVQNQIEEHLNGK